MDGRIDFAINFVSLQKISCRVNGVPRYDTLNDIESGEENVLSVFILSHSRNVGFENLYDMLTILVDQQLALRQDRKNDQTDLGSAPGQELAYDPASVFRVYHICKQVFAAAC